VSDDVEDKLVFPLAAKFLTPSEKSAIAQEMAARREVEAVWASLPSPPLRNL